MRSFRNHWEETGALRRDHCDLYWFAFRPRAGMQSKQSGGNVMLLFLFLVIPSDHVLVFADITKPEWPVIQKPCLLVSVHRHPGISLWHIDNMLVPWGVEVLRHFLTVLTIIEVCFTMTLPACVVRDTLNHKIITKPKLYCTVVHCHIIVQRWLWTPFVQLARHRPKPTNHYRSRWQLELMPWMEFHRKMLIILEILNKCSWKRLILNATVARQSIKKLSFR